MATLIPALGTCLHRMTSGAMAERCRDRNGMEICCHALAHKGLPHRMRRKAGDFKPEANTIKVMRMHACKGLVWPMAAIFASKHKDNLSQEDLEMEFKLAYIAATRSTNKLITP